VGVIFGPSHLKDLGKASRPHFVHRFVKLRWIFMTEYLHPLNLILPCIVSRHLNLFLDSNHATSHVNTYKLQCSERVFLLFFRSVFKHLLDKLLRKIMPKRCTILLHRKSYFLDYTSIVASYHLQIISVIISLRLFLTHSPVRTLYWV